MNDCMTSRILFCILIVLIVLTGCQKQAPIGGDKDDHGCLVGAGYSWNESVTACIREWELDQDQREAVRIVVLPMSYRPIHIDSVEKLDCEGCYLVTINTEQGPRSVELESWQVVT